MTTDLIIPLIGWSLLGSLFLMILHRLIAQAFPRPPVSVLRSTFKAQQPPAEEEGDGLSAVYAMDEALLNAELERPGSTFWLYYRQPGAVFARLLGSLLVAFPVVIWIPGSSRLNCGTLLPFLLGLGLSAYPYQTWWMSRPTLKK